MATSFVEFRTKGFWVPDSLLEVWLYFLAQSIDELGDSDVWLRQLQQHWFEQSGGICTGCVWAGLDDFATTDERAARIIALNEQLLEYLDTFGDSIPKDKLNQISSEEIVWLDDLEVDELKRVGRFFIRLLRGELITDAATSRSISRDELLL